MLNKKEKELRKQALKKIEDELPEAQCIKEPAPSIKKTPAWVAPLTVAASVLLLAAVALPIALTNLPKEEGGLLPTTSKTSESSVTATPSSFTSAEQKVQDSPKALEEMLNDALFYDAGDSGEPMALPTLKRAYEKGLSFYYLERGFDETVAKKIVITVDQSHLQQDSYYQEHGNDYSGWFLYEGGCILYSDLMHYAHAYLFDIEEKVPSIFQEEEVLGISYIGKMTLLDDLLDDTNPSDLTSYEESFWVKCEKDDEGYLVEKPVYGFRRTLNYLENPSLYWSKTSLYFQMGGKVSHGDFHWVPYVTIGDDGMLNLPGCGIFGFDNSDSFSKTPFHLDELEPYIENYSSWENPPISYETLKQIVLSYKDYYRNEIDLNPTVFEESFAPSEMSTKGTIYRSYEEWMTYQEEELRSRFGEELFDTSVLVHIKVSEINTGYKWNDYTGLFYEKSVRKGDDIILYFSKTPYKENNAFGKNIFIAIPKEDFRYLGVSPLAMVRPLGENGKPVSSYYLGITIDPPTF